MTKKILLVHIGWIFIAREGTNPVTGSTPCVKGKNNFFVLKKKCFCDESKWKIIHKTEYIFYVTQTVLLVIGGTFPVTRNIPIWQEKLPVKARIHLLRKEVEYLSQLEFFIGNFLPLTRIEKNTSCHRTFFLWKKGYFLSQEINFLSWEEQRTPRVTGRMFHCAGNILYVTDLRVDIPITEIHIF